MGWANVYRDPSVSVFFEEKAWYSIIINGNVLIMIRVVEAGKMCVRILPKL